MADAHRVRIAQLGFAGERVAESLAEVRAGADCYWVEIDGHRFDAIVSATVRIADDEVTVPSLTLQIIGAVEIVYVDSDGEPLPGERPTETTVDHHFEHGTLRMANDG